MTMSTVELASNGEVLTVELHDVNSESPQQHFINLNLLQPFRRELFHELLDTV
jgi:hypothetical protein